MIAIFVMDNRLIAVVVPTNSKILREQQHSWSVDFKEREHWPSMTIWNDDISASWHTSSRHQTSRGWINIKMPSYQYRKSHCGDKTILRPSHILHNGISYTGKTSSLYTYHWKFQGTVECAWSTGHNHFKLRSISFYHASPQPILVDICNA